MQGSPLTVLATTQVAIWRRVQGVLLQDQLRGSQEETNCGVARRLEGDRGERGAGG